MTFQQKLDSVISKNNSLLCVGLDSDWEKIPAAIKQKVNPQFAFNKAIIDATHELVCAYKPNSAFYEYLGSEGIRQLKLTCEYLHETYPDIPIILDAKRGDIGNTNKGYASFAFDYLQADAITLHPYLGQEAVQPFLNYENKGCIILCRTSNPGSSEFQNISVVLSASAREESSPSVASKNAAARSLVATQDDTVRKPFYMHIAEQVITKWNADKNCLLVVGATYPEELANIRKLSDEMTLLIPGIGTQGGDLEATLKAGLNSKKSGLIISASRSIIFASKENDFTEKARQETEKLKDEINKYR